MAETYHFNTHNVKTEELNSKIIKIWPRSEDENLRCDILDLIYSPFSVIEGAKLEPIAAKGWFIPSLLSDNKIVIDGVEYMATDTDNIEEDFVNIINSIETSPVTAFIEDIADREEGEEYAGIRIILVAKEPGEDGNEITLGYVSEPNLNDGTFSNGDTLEGGKDERTIVDIMPGTVYLPSNVIANIPKKEGLEVKSDEVDYIILTLKRSAHGTISYKYSVAKETLGENYIIVEPLEEIDEEATQEPQN